MEKVNFIEIAKVCQEQSRVNHTVWRNMTRYEEYVDKSGCYANQVMYLRRDDDNSGILYSCDTPWNDKMQTVWDIYMKTRDCSLFEARQLSFMVFRDKILAQHSKEIKELEVSKKFLEQEVAAYKGMLDDIKSLLENHETTKR